MNTDKTSADPYDIAFYWDPVCPFAWITSRWIYQVIEQKAAAGDDAYRVDWRFISLRIINKNVDYDSHFPADYEEGHTAGLRMLRVAAKVRAEHGRDVMGAVYTEMGAGIHDVEPDQFDKGFFGTPDHVVPMLERLDLPIGLADALYDESWDAEIEAETNEARTKTGTDVGTPIIHFNPPEGPALFGPVISRLPADEDAVKLWDHVVGLATFPSFTELKRSLRERPALRSLGMDPDQVGVVEDWHGGSRRTKN